MNAKADWQPVLNGKFYGSPACCGSSFCTREEYEWAVEKAAEMSNSLGEGWRPAVHENLGWHPVAVKGNLRVSFSRGVYSATSGSRYSGSGITTRLAVDAMRQAAEHERERCERVVRECEE